MAATIGALRVDLGLETAEFKKGAKQAQDTATELYTKLKETAIHIAEAFALEKVYEGLKSIVEGMESVVLTAQKMGVPVETLSKMQLAADVTHTSMESLAGGVEKLSKNLEAVAGGKGGNAALALRALGISATDAHGKLKPTEETLLAIAGKFEGMRDGANKTALAIALFGKAGAELIPFLNRGKDGIAAFMAKAEEMGVAISEGTAKKLEAFSADLTTLEYAFVGIARQVVTYLLPSMDNLTQSLVNFMSKGGGAQKIAEAIGAALIKMAEYAVQIYGAIEKAGITAVYWYDRLNNAYDPKTWDDYKKSIAAVNVEIAHGIDLIKEYTAPHRAHRGDGQGGGPLGATQKPDAPGFTGIGVSDEAAKAAKKHAEAIQKVIDELRIQNEEFGKGALQMKIDQTLRQHDIESTSKQGREISALIIKHAKLQAEEQSSLQIATNLADAKKKMMAGLEEVATLGVDALDSWIQGSKSLGDALQGLLQQLASMALQAALLGKGPLGGLFGGGGAGVGLLGGLLGIGKTSLYADGGQIPSGQWGIVGEGGGMQHAELVQGPATVTPLSQINGGGGTTIHIDARGADAGQIAQLRVQMKQMAKDLQKTVIGTVTREKQANMRFAQ